VINRVVAQRYEVVEKLGESPLFVVYKARDNASDRVVALKTVQPAYAADAAFLEGLTAGMKATANLNHPHIARFEEQGIEDGVPYIITDIVRGINLKERVRRIAPFTLSVAIDFACAIGEALHFAHSLGQPHGDLRPHNIIISPEGTLRITDFGVARGIARSPQAQREILLRSAAPYHAPELSTTQPGSVAGDVYALGAIVYEMLTGVPPYAAESPDALADQHAFAEIPSPRTINPGVPRAVEGILFKCLQKRAEQRYRSTAELLNDLKAVRDALRFGKPLSWTPVIEDLPPVAEPPKPTARGEGRGRREKTPILDAPTAQSPIPDTRHPTPVSVLEPVAEVAASSEAVPMPAATNRLREKDERVSIYIRAAIVAVTMLILVVLIGIVGVWSSMWVVPKPVTAPEFVGKSIEDARTLAEKLGVRLIEHAEYVEKPRGTVYKTDLDRNARIRPKQAINLWYSKGPTFVDVPKVVGLTREDAENKLQESGLAVGPVTMTNSETVPPNVVVKQTVSFKKRVMHDTAVGLVLSDGPKLEYAPQTEENPLPGEVGTSTEVGPDESLEPEPNSDPDIQPEDLKPFRRTISIPRDSRGLRQVRVEYRDDRGGHTPVIDEPHDEGDRIPISFDYYGKNITLMIFYDDVKVFGKTFDPQATRNERIR
jgi:eukaryotic-like serine/threonine-protein kinase